MAKKLEDYIASRPKEEQKAIADGFEQMSAQYMALQSLRKAMHFTQEQIASELDMDQSNLSKLEKRSDLLLSTLRRYVEAMGGELHLVAKFPGKPPIEVTGFGDQI